MEFPDAAIDRRLLLPDGGTTQSPLTPPTPARMFLIAADLDKPTDEEEAWFDENPAAFEDELRLRHALEREFLGPSADIRNKRHVTTHSVK